MNRITSNSFHHKPSFDICIKENVILLLLQPGLKDNFLWPGFGSWSHLGEMGRKERQWKRAKGARSLELSFSPGRTFATGKLLGVYARWQIRRRRHLRNHHRPTYMHAFSRRPPTSVFSIPMLKEEWITEENKEGTRGCGNGDERLGTNCRKSHLIRRETF